jgi:hypothetical protein
MRRNSIKNFTVLFLIGAFAFFVLKQTSFAQDKQTATTAQPKTVVQQPTPQTPTATVLEFYRLMRAGQFREAFTLTIFKAAIEGLTAEEMEDLKPDFQALAQFIPDKVELGGEQINGNNATVKVKIKDIDEDKIVDRPVQLRRGESGGWVMLAEDPNAEAAVKRDGKNYFFNLRIETHHDEVVTMIDRIAKAEFVYATQSGGFYADLPTLVRAGLLPDDVLSSASTGYNFRLSLSNDKKSYTGGAEPARYGRTGRYSYYFTVNAYDKKDTGGKPYQP